MIKINEYFDGNVKSLSFQNEEGKATVGVMETGEFEFGTSTIEYMTVVSGEMEVMLPGQNNWALYKPYETFVVPANVKFKVKIKIQTAYKCIYK